MSNNYSNHNIEFDTFPQNGQQLRISWDEYFSRVADSIALRSTCPRATVGAVAVKGYRILGHGYNGAPKGLPHCEDVGCLVINNHCCRTVHAEVNAILMSGSCHGATLYSTHLPCLECCKLVIQSGIVAVVYRREYVDDRTQAFGITQRELLVSSDIDCFHLPGDQNVITK